MKITGEIANVINIVKKNDAQTRRTEAGDARAGAYDSVAVENKQAAGVSVANLDEARNLVQNITSGLNSNPAELHKLNSQRLTNLIN